MPDLANTLIGGRYRLERRLGVGGMGEVWAATDTRLDRPVALKILRSGMAVDPGVRLRFESEARSAARLHHPNVVAVFDAGADTGDGDGEGGQLWLVMERLPGPTLVDRMAQGPLSSAEALTVASDVLAGLAAAHKAMLVHRDIKPSNLLQAADGTWKIADFGIAKPLDGAADLTATGATIGTPSYLSPEQLEGRAATPASDLWAVGVVLYEALAGRKPFAGETPFAIAHAVRSEEPEPIAQVRPDVDPALATAITAAMAKDPDRRPHDAAAMAAILAGAPAVAATGHTMQQPVAAAAPVATALPPAAPAGSEAETAGSRRRTLAWATAALVVVAGVVLIALLAAGAFDGTNTPNPTTTTTPTTATNATTPSTGSRATTIPTTRPTTTSPTTTSTSTSTTKPTTTSSSTTSSTSTTKPTTTSSTTTSTTKP